MGSSIEPVSRYSERAASSPRAAVSKKLSSPYASMFRRFGERVCFSFSRRAAWSTGWSILLRNRNTGTLWRSKSRQRVRVWPWGPSGPETTRRAQSRTWRVRSASAAKSTWPGVSSSVSSTSGRGRTACFKKMVMPRSRSRLSWSKKASA